ncbi:hypothetical protein [Ruegeria halocynthiae]|uniref:Abi-alpha family protein n=1 Tax=Ruegeria halocynthiae TaxID=985054 RepID=UPI0006895D32|nr:hypothetical protein [Ruegeria halocynthiae]
MTENKNNNVINVNLPGDAIDKAAGQVISKLFGGASDGALDVAGNVFGGLIGDRIREWRTRNLIHTTARTAEFLKEKGISLEDAKALPMGDIYRIFEGASKEEEPSVQDMWAKLLASSLDMKNSDLNKAIYPVLEQFSGIDAKVFNLVNQYWLCQRRFDQSFHDDGILVGKDEDLYSERVKIFQAEISEILDEIEPLKRYEIDLSTANLVRLQCIAPSDAQRSTSIWGSAFEKTNIGFARPSLTEVDTDKIAEEFCKVSDRIGELFGLRDYPEIIFQNAFTGKPECNFQPTDFGSHLFETCIE